MAVRHHIFVGRALRLPFSSTHGKRSACPAKANKKMRFIKQKTMRRSHGQPPRSLRRHYPHQVQGVSGKFTGLSATQLPRIICFQNKTGSLQVNATKNCTGVCTKRRVLERRSPRRAPLQLWLAAPCSLLFSLSLGCRLFHIGVENGLPSALCHFPNRSGIEGA